MWKGFSGLKRDNHKKKRSAQVCEAYARREAHYKTTVTAPQAIENIREALDKYAQRLKDLITKFNTQEREVIATQEKSKQGPRKNRISRSAAATLTNERKRIQAKRRTAEKQLTEYHKLIAIHGTRDELAKAYFGLQLADVETPTGEHLERLKTEAAAQNQRRHQEHTERLNTETA